MAYHFGQLLNTPYVNMYECLDLQWECLSVAPCFSTQVPAHVLPTYLQMLTFCYVSFGIESIIPVFSGQRAFYPRCLRHCGLWGHVTQISAPNATCAPKKFLAHVSDHYYGVLTTQ